MNATGMTSPLAMSELAVAKIRSLELLGHRGKFKFTQDEQSLRVTLPPEKPSDHAICCKIAI